MIALVLAGVCILCATGYWWLGRTATPGQIELEERWRANRGALRRGATALPGMVFRLGRGKDHGPEWWAREPPRDTVPEPEEHKEPWRR